MKYNIIDLPVKGCLEDAYKNEQELKKALLKYGLLEVYLYGNSLRNYIGGIIRQPRDCERTGDRYFYNIVGYGKDYDIEYWIIKGRYGPAYDDKGYFKIQIGKNLCGFGNETFSVQFKKY